MVMNTELENERNNGGEKMIQEGWMIFDATRLRILFQY